MKSYTVYMHINKINGKRYIGITCQKPEKRWRNGKGYEGNGYFIKAINKYGWDNFEHIIIAKGLDEEEAKWLEIELIREWDTTNKDKGYNITLGGDGTSGCNPLERMTDEQLKEWKRKQSEARKGENNCMYGKHHSEETKKKLSEALKGENNPMYGKNHSEESKKKMNEPKSEDHKRKISEAHKGKILSEEHKKKISETRKSKYCSEDAYWYGKNHSEETRKKMSEVRKGKYYGKNSTHAKPVICITTGRIFYTIKESSEYYGCHKVSISNCCNEKCKSAGKLPDGTKLVWRYIKIIEL